MDLRTAQRLKPELANPMYYMHGEIGCGICCHREAFPPGSAAAALQRITAHVLEHLNDAARMVAAEANNGNGKESTRLNKWR